MTAAPLGWGEDETPAAYAQGAEVGPGSTATTILGAPQAPHGGRPAVTLEDVADQLAEVLRRLDHIDATNNGTRRDLAQVVEFVDVVKAAGTKAAQGGGMPGMLLKQFVPGITNLAG